MGISITVFYLYFSFAPDLTLASAWYHSLENAQTHTDWHTHTPIKLSKVFLIQQITHVPVKIPNGHEFSPRYIFHSSVWYICINILVCSVCMSKSLSCSPPFLFHLFGFCFTNFSNAHDNNKDCYLFKKCPFWFGTILYSWILILNSHSKWKDKKSYTYIYK